MTPHPIAYDRNTNTWITYSGEFNSYAEALKTIKPLSPTTLNERT